MTTSQPDSLNLSTRSLLVSVVGAALAASALVVCFVLPAEYRIDPTGIGKLTGVMNLAPPRQVKAQDVAPATPAAGGTAGAGVATVADRYYESGYRSDTVNIPLATETGQGGSELEYKVRMKAGQTLVYSWTVAGIKNPEEFYFDFHGEGGGKVSAGESKVIEYRQITGTSSSGMLVAPFDGIFGWYLQNQSEASVTVNLNLGGFYQLIPPGEYGNEAGIKATPRSAN
jgi:hypothetical protein